MQTWFDKVGVEELKQPMQNPDLNPTEDLQDELVCKLRARPLTSVTNLTNALVAHEQYLTSMHQNLMENFPRKVKFIDKAKRNKSRMGC